MIGWLNPIQSQVHYYPDDGIAKNEQGSVEALTCLSKTKNGK